VRNISVIFLCHNNPHIKLCLDAAHGMMADGDEIIVVDDHSEQATLETLRSLQDKITLIHSHKKGNRSHNRKYTIRIYTVNSSVAFHMKNMSICYNRSRAGFS
jgi:glycosyltransferase involved in cell wall biosynthesis